ncbi:DNA polymerase [Gordonia phage Cozz]|uniref:DNA polymerase I n=3 Tax=Emalynvirus cozz TaxID=2560490 RepID=A0A4Y5NZA4_9CAUD|nr:DNA polymerase [Gordonia phage Cozz]ANA85747.1 DNA polymerase I [Gordonia phage Cozz]AZS11796.1 DNA polymerase I [Gordonia phage Nina]QCW22375.1 DNA polymerase I [Gordonia phage Agatha]
MKLLIVSKYRLRGRGEQLMEGLVHGQKVQLGFMGIDPHRRVADGADFTKAILRELRGDFEEFLTNLEQQPDAILALGNEALFVTTGHSGIMKWRGKDLAVGRIPLMASLAPAAVERNPSQGALLRADVAAIIRTMKGEKPADGILPDRVRVAASKSTLSALLGELRDASAVAFDLETSGFDERAEGAFIVSIALTITNQSSGVDTCWAVPLCHRASVWSSRWEKVLQVIARDMRKVPTRIAHNAKFDCRWMVQFDAAVPVNFDTMLAAHLLDENRAKGLKPLARVLLDAPEWDIQIKGGRTSQPWYHQHPLKEILKYNAYDTWHTMGLYHLFHQQLLEDPLAFRLLRKLVMPASQSLVHIERRGVYVDREKLEESTLLVAQELDRIHTALGEYVPDEIPDGMAVNWNPSKFLRWLLFEHLGLPVIEEGKTGPSTKEEVMMHLAEDYDIAKLLLERVKWQKFNSGFIAPYQELLTSESRLHTTFKLAGTVTGRLSSGKADLDKVTGAKKVRGVNMQQVPRDPIIRGVFGAAPGWTFIEADYSQVELRIAAELAQEPTMLGLYSRGEDIHMAMAMRMTGKPASEVTKEERKKAKAVNFGFLYGMGWRKFIQTAYTNYGVAVTEREAQDFRKAFFEQFPTLVRWHARQRRLVTQYKRVQSPLGRVRHLPDVDSQDEGVVAEAQRQAINSPVQATASDLCLLSLVLLDREFRKRGLRAAPIGTVHDAINFECPDEELEEVIPLIKEVMEHPPTQQLFGYHFKVPIVSDVAVGQHWGHKTEIPGDIVNSPQKLRDWLKEHHS